MRMNWTRARHRQRMHQQAPRVSTMIHHSSRRSCRAVRPARGILASWTGIEVVDE
jgi:hypothetical protein